MTGGFRFTDRAARERAEESLAPAAEATDDWDEQSPAVVRDVVDSLLGIALAP